MRLIKTDSVAHMDSKSIRHAIYSMDFQPFGKRLATAGGDCTVKLWDVTVLLRTNASTENADDGDDGGCLLATLSNHSKSVNTVRWCKSGEYLASGSDDNYVLVYKYTPGAIANQSFGSGNNGSKNKETWTRCYSLQGHGMDVLDLDWSPRGLIASASVDNNVILWDLSFTIASDVAPPAGPAGRSGNGSLLAPYKVLSGHSSFVKGVAFDPLGRYLVSVGADNIVIVWDGGGDGGGNLSARRQVGSGGEWALLRRLEEPLLNSPDRAMFRRLSWSPDGQFVCLSAANKMGKPVGMVLRRGSWDSVADLVGHSTSSLCTRFCPYVFSISSPAPNAPSTVNDESINQTSSVTTTVSCITAVGDQTGIVSIWGTHSSKALFVVRDALNGAAVTDIAWAHLQNAETVMSAVETASSLHGVVVMGCCGIEGHVVLVDLGFGFSCSNKKKAETAGAGAGVTTRGGGPTILSGAGLDKHFEGLYGRSRSQQLRVEAQPLLFDAISLQYSNSSRTSGNEIGGVNGGSLSTSAPTPLAPSTAFATGISTLQSKRKNDVWDRPGQSIQQRQQETMTVTGKDGKKRIRPVLLQTADGIPTAAARSLESSGVLPAEVRYSSSNSEGLHSSKSNDRVSSLDRRLEGSQPFVGKGFSSSSGDYPTSSTSSSSHATKRVRGSVEGSLSNRSNSNSNIGNTRSGLLDTAQRSSKQVLTVKFSGDNSSEFSMGLPLQPVLADEDALTDIERRNNHSKPEFLTKLVRHIASSGSVGSRGLRGTVLGEESVKPRLIIQAIALAKPSGLIPLRLSGGTFSTILLSLAIPANSAPISSNSFSSVLSVADDPVVVWSTVVSGNITCVAGAEVTTTLVTDFSAGDAATAANKDRNGLCLVGCSDGTLYVISLSCGMRIMKPLVIGAAVAAVDVCFYRGDGDITSDVASSDKVVGRAMALTVDGEIYVWEVLNTQPANSTFARTSSVFYLRSSARTQLRPILLSMKCRSALVSKASAVDVRKTNTVGILVGSSADTKSAQLVDSIVHNDPVQTGIDGQAMLKSTADVSVHIEHCGFHLCGDGINGAELCVSAYSAGAVGGDWQQFSFCELAGTWSRDADMRHMMSDLFVAFPQQQQQQHGIEVGSSDDGSSASEAHLQSIAAMRSRYSTSDVLAISRVALKDSLSASSHRTVFANGSSGSSSNSSSKSVGANEASNLQERNTSLNEATTTSVAIAASIGTRPLTIAQWSEIATISHVEDRLCAVVATGSNSRGDKGVVAQWLSQWVLVCCSHGLHDRVQWLVSNLVAVYHAKKQSSQRDTALHAITTASSSSSSSSMGLTKWIWSLDEPLAVLKEVIMPALASVGAKQQHQQHSSDARGFPSMNAPVVNTGMVIAAQSLLGDIAACIELL